MKPTKPLPDLDENDLEILRELEQNDEKNLEELAAELDLSKSTIHYRLNRLKEDGVITDISADIDPQSLGLAMVVITEVNVSHERGYADEIGDGLVDVEGVQQVYYTMGDVDFVVISRVQNHDQMNEVIDDIVAIDGVNETSSRFVMRELKDGNRLLENMSDEMIGNVLETE
ncbi:Lrp/AsnC family transcriptional regulator [Natronorubrum texcoconense]|uniref:DNA-binding transcriptional regulator, Lrp family n=1 Tax=Natronorubrum texcoconense TaxID=1095776 RepID=A0A1G9DFI0_9EURY|nr:Lrp/AsnC family transcriptional regulator [Natronorubrum texcoconense]SDK62651.1 DNA-binding transcriptional regulator, Lrp family [Natronorubrum texcoconense]